MSDLNIENKNVTVTSQDDQIQNQVSYVSGQEPNDSHSGGCCGDDSHDVKSESEPEVDDNELETRNSPTRITKILKDGVKQQADI